VSLPRAEWRRLFKRRLTKGMLTLGVLILAAIAVGVYLSHHKATPDQVAAAERRAEAAYRDNLRFTEQFREQCEQAKQTSGAQPAQQGFPSDCDEITAPSRDDFRAEYFMAPTFDFREMFPPTLIVVAAVLGLVAFVIGASYIGADWASGGLMNLLLWRPQRLRVLFTKLGTLAGGLLVTGALLTTAWGGAMWLTAVNRGTTTRLTPGFWQSVTLGGVRAVALILFAGVLGFALASIGRHTGVALGVAVTIVLVGQFGVAFVLSLAGVPFWERYLIPTYVEAFMSTKTTLFDYSVPCRQVGNECEFPQLVITWQDAGGVFAAILVLVIGLAAWQIRRRDIT
jgi:ABC-2 type transport system permease protein